MPLTEPDLWISHIRLFNHTHSVFNTKASHTTHLFPLSLQQTAQGGNTLIHRYIGIVDKIISVYDFLSISVYSTTNPYTSHLIANPFE